MTLGRQPPSLGKTETRLKMINQSQAETRSDETIIVAFPYYYRLEVYVSTSTTVIPDFFFSAFFINSC